jgi:hypothetical protein
LRRGLHEDNVTQHNSLSHLSRDQVTALAHRAHKAKRNAEAKIMAAGKILIGGGAALGTAALLGNMMGGLEYEYETAENKEAIDAGTEPDPRKWGAVDKDVAIAAIIATLGLVGALVSKKDSAQFASYTVAQAGIGGLSGAVYSKSHAVSFNRKKTDTENAA